MPRPILLDKKLVLFRILLVLALLFCIHSLFLGKAQAGGPPPAKSLEEAHPFDFPDLPEGIGSKEARRHVGKALHRLYDLVALREYEMADAYWEKLRAYQEEHAESLSPFYFHSILWSIGYGKGNDGEKAVAAYMYARALEIIETEAMLQTRHGTKFSQGRYNEYLVLFSNAANLAVSAGWIEEAKDLTLRAESFLKRGFELDLSGKEMPVYGYNYQGELVPLNYPVCNYLGMRSVMHFLSGDIEQSEFFSRWILEIWKTHVPREKVKLERGYNRNHYSIDNSSISAYFRLIELYDLIREPGKALELSRDMAKQTRLNEDFGGATMLNIQRQVILREARMLGFSQETLERFDSVRVSLPDFDKEVHDPSDLSWRETSAKAEILWELGRIEEARRLYEEKIADQRQTTDTRAWARLLIDYLSLRLANGETDDSVETELLELLDYSRKRGIKPDEFELYLLYAKWQQNRGEITESIRMLQQALSVAEFIGYPKLFDLVDSKLKQLLDGLLVVEAGPSLPEDVNSKPRTGNGAAPAMDETSAAEDSYTGSAPEIDLQPFKTTVVTASNEYARARFSLSSLAGGNQKGQLRFTAPDQTTIDVKSSQNEVWIHTRGTSLQSFSQALELRSTEQWLIFVETDGQASSPITRLDLNWESRGVQQTASALFVEDSQKRGIHSVHSSRGLNNPFYAIPFYHEIYFRDSLPELANVRVVASHECRIEYYDPNSFTLLATDSNGDGDFEDAGDVLYTDADHSGHTEIGIDGEEGLGTIEFNVYLDGVADPLSLRLELFSDGHWVELSVDELISHPILDWQDSPPREQN